MLTLVNFMKILPQEIEVWYIIPAIRREFAKCLIKDFDASYEKVGQILGISKAAVSQYMNGKRAAKIVLNGKVHEQIDKSCEKLIKGKSDSVVEIQKILEFIKNKKVPCEVCKKLKEAMLSDCKEIRFDGNGYK